MKIKNIPEKPLYKQIYLFLKQQIEEGKLGKGEIIPSENELADQFSASRVTIRRALLELQGEKYLIRKRGYGTEVSYPPETNKDGKSVAAILTDVTRLFFALILKGIQDKLSSEGYNLICCDTENLCEKEKEYLLKHGNSVSGLVIAPATGNRNHAYYGELLSNKVPFVFVDRYIPEFNIDAVVSDNVQGGYLAVKHLLDLGHRRIALLSEPEATSLQGRIEGYKKALAEYGLDPEENLVFSSEKREFHAGYGLIEEIVRSHPDVTAAFCLYDDIAWGALKKLSEMGIRVPQDFSIVGFDNSDFASKLYPLTTVNQEKYQMGVKAAEILLGRITGKLTARREMVFLPVELVIRESTDKPRLKSFPKKGLLRGEKTCSNKFSPVREKEVISGKSILC